MKLFKFCLHFFGVFFILQSTFESNTLAIVAKSDCAGNGTVVIFGNGMFNSSNDVNNSLVELKKLPIADIESSPSRISYDVAVNLSESQLDNILTVIEQKVNGDLSYFWNVMDAIIPMPDWLIEPIIEAFGLRYDDHILSTHLNLYAEYLHQSKKIILVSHSQGNFYAEESLNRIGSTGFGNVRVATPAQSQYDYPYFTFKDDLIIQWVRGIAGAPEPNLDTAGSGLGPVLDPNGHNFVQAYLTNTESRTKITEAIISVAESTAYPCHF